MLHTRIFTFNPLETNCIVLWQDGEKRCIIVDPGMSSPEGCGELTDFLSANGLTPQAILLTHGHFDHVWGVEKLCAGRQGYHGKDDFRKVCRGLQLPPPRLPHP